MDDLQKRSDGQKQKVEKPPARTSRFPGFYKLDIWERLDKLEDWFPLTTKEKWLLKNETLKAEKGASISALSVSPDGQRLAWGDEEGEAGVIALPDISAPRQFAG